MFLFNNIEGINLITSFLVCVLYSVVEILGLQVKFLSNVLSIIFSQAFYFEFLLSEHIIYFLEGLLLDVWQYLPLELVLYLFLFV